MPSENSSKRPEVSVNEFLESAAGQMPLELFTGEESIHEHFLDSARVQKLGLALSGFTHRIHRGRIQIFGNSEAYFFETLKGKEVPEAIARLDGHKVSCILVTAGNVPPEELLVFARQNKIPLLRTSIPSSEAISSVTEILGFALAPVITTHGVLLEIFGIGVMLIGESGIGKSECALDLIGRGHRLISDDSVMLRRIGDRISGESPAITRDHLEIRGLGIINARELFGVSALGQKVDVSLAIEFIGELEHPSMDRLGLDSGHFQTLGVEIPKYVLPVRPGRNLATLAETAVRVFVSRKSGSTLATDLFERHDAALKEANAG